MSAPKWTWLAALSLFAACSRIDPGQGARYVCSRQASEPERECPGGWVCGLEGFCLNPATPAANRCETQSDCFQGWHCGVEGVCYNRTTATAVGCRDNDDCSPDWRCGLNHSCHARDAGAAYECLTDDDCEAHWRCGPEQKCIDSQNDALRPNLDAGLPVGQLLSPLVPGGTAEKVAISDKFYSSTECDGGIDSYFTTSFSLVADGGLTKVLRHDGFFLGKPTYGPSCERLASIPIQAQHLPGVAHGVRALAEEHDKTYVLYQDGGITRFVLGDAGIEPQDIAPPTPGFVFTRLKLGSTSSGAIVASNADTAGIWLQNDSWLMAPPIVLNDGGTAVINDVALLGDYRRGYLVAGTEEGLFGVQLGTNGPTALWEPYELTPQECNSMRKDNFAVERIDVSQATSPAGSMPVVALQLRTRAQRNQPARLALMTKGQVAAPPCPMMRFEPGDITVFELSAYYSRTCEGDFTSYAVGGFGDGGVDVLAQCRYASDGGVNTQLERLIPWQSFQIGGSNDDETPALELLKPTTVFSASNPRRTAMLGAHGELWFDDEQNVFPLGSLALTEVPDVVGGTIDRPFAAQPPLIFNPLRNDSFPMTSYEVSEYTKGAGFLNLAEEAALVTHVEGQPHWLVAQYSLPDRTMALVVDTRGNGIPLESRPSGLVATSDVSLLKPTLAVSAPSADGGTSLVMSVQDALLAADISQVPDGGLPFSADSLSLLPSLKVVASIVPRANITSLWGLPADPDPARTARYAEGYLVTAGRVFRYHADNPIVWRSEELVVTAAEAVEVWSDGRRARAGFRDGAVFSLPSRVQLAPPIESGTSLVTDFAQACGHAFALTAGGLYQLVAGEGDVVGHWRKVPLVSDSAQPDYASGRLHSDGSALLVFLPHGVVEHVTGFQCLP